MYYFIHQELENINSDFDKMGLNVRLLDINSLNRFMTCKIFGKHLVSEGR